MKLPVALITAILVSTSAAAQQAMEGRGRVFNADGAWCWFTQSVEKKAVPFLAHKGKIAIMVFDDPACMAETTKEGNDFAANFNRTQIAKRIAGLVRGNWVTKDTNYNVASRYKPGMMQKARGVHSRC